MLESKAINLEDAKTIEVFTETKKENIFYLRVILESYEGLAIMTTVNDESTLLKFACLKCNFEDCINLLKSLERESLLSIKKIKEV
ncbi:DUF4911 domain-containing protein [Thermotomaculum hydrothermale]|uniref:DUF4911 domain-containing protein n=1 Tax=Thermotomaculum hydrothermale TaxID=981385 RepID=UPI0019169707|nr:DUF4911 domain-containing protein [Thermotomaculum hydrothermale]